MIPQAVLDRIDKEKGRYIEELFDFIKIPGVSTDPDRAGDIRDAAKWVYGHLEKLGFNCQIFETEGHPVVYANRCPHKGAFTLLIYGHYDVQPAEPLDEWVSPPFSPEIRKGDIYGRGASDDKGQFFTYLKAIDAVLKECGEIPINIKVLVEGEEEIGSPNLMKLVKKHKKRLKADAIAISDGSQFGKGIPSICYGLRGITYMQVDVFGPSFDVHSGVYGGPVINPAHVLVDILHALKDADGKVTIPGFYDDVRDIEMWECHEMKKLPFNESEMKEYLGVCGLKPEKGYSTIECLRARPTLDINGICGGFTGEGVKTIIPAKASAKISMRLVPDQDPQKIASLFTKYVMSIAPEGVSVEVKDLQGTYPVIVQRQRECMDAASRSIKKGFGKEPVFIRDGYTIGIVNDFKQVLGIEDILLLGWGSPDDGAHSPNEKFSVDDLLNGIRSAAALMFELKKIKG
jgi:acetylornithine deacetylase/succinyl-diaminopimelate desuccinylase-like protein